MEAFVAALNQVDTGDQDKLLDGLPNLVTCLQADPEWPRPVCLPLYREVLEYLFLAGGGASPSRTAATGMLGAVLACTDVPGAYTEALETVAGFFPFALQHDHHRLVHRPRRVDRHVSVPRPASASPSGISASPPFAVQPLALSVIQTALLGELAGILQATGAVHAPIGPTPTRCAGH